MIFIAAFDHQIISDASTRLCDIFDTALMRTFNVISKREECIRTERYIGQLIQPCPFFFAGEYVWFYFEDLFPCTVSQHIHILFTDIDINGIVTLRSADGIKELQPKNLWRLAKEPVVCLLSCQAGTVYAGLLSGTDSDGLSIFDIADGVGLCIFQDDQSYFHIDQSLLWNFLILSYNIGKKFIVNIQFIAALFKGDSIDLLFLDRSRYVIRIDLNDIIISFFLLLQKFQCLFGISGCDHTIGYLSFDQARSIQVTHIR